MVVCSVSINVDLLSLKSNTYLDRIIENAFYLYTLKKRVAYLIAFKQYIVAKSQKRNLCKLKLDANYLDNAFMDVVKFVQKTHFGTAIKLLQEKSSDAYDLTFKKLGSSLSDLEHVRRVSELKTLRNLRPCVDNDLMLRVEGRHKNTDLPTNTKHPLILPSRHQLTRLIVFDEHAKAGHAGPCYTLMRTRQRFWIVYEISSDRRYLRECVKCAMRKAKSFRQLMADLPACRVTATNKSFKYCGVDYLGPYFYRRNRSNCKCWDLLYTCLCTRCIHVEIVTSLDLNEFLLAFSRITNLQGAVDTI